MYFLCEQVDDGGYVLAAAPHVRQLPEQRGGQVAGGDGGAQGARQLLRVALILQVDQHAGV